MSAAILSRLRETLEEALPRAEAARVLFAALERFGVRIPADHAELVSFVHGQLQRELGKHLQGKPLGNLLAELDEVLHTADALTADREIPIEIDEWPQWRDEASTEAIRSIAGPVPVLVVASTGALAIRLRAVLGDEAIDVEARDERAGIERALGSGPALAIVDALDVTRVDVDTLAKVLVHATRTQTIVWGSELPYGRRLIEASGVVGVEIAGVATSEGVGALLDRVLARRS